VTSVERLRGTGAATTRPAARRLCLFGDRSKRALRFFQTACALFIAAPILISLSLWSLAAEGETSAKSPFNPLREHPYGKPLWLSTDRRSVDIEIIGSTSRLPDIYRLEPERTLRFRLERAYVRYLVAEKTPGLEAVTFAVDMETGLPSYLFDVVSFTDRFHQNIPGIPVVSRADRARRELRISLKSDSAAKWLSSTSDKLKPCRGAEVGPDLQRYEWKDRGGCSGRGGGTEARYVASYNDLFLNLKCTDPWIASCSFPFPFEGFAVEVSFHRDHLLKWREMIKNAESFLQSKKYPTH
jgi:hypothetical protein